MNFDRKYFDSFLSKFHSEDLDGCKPQASFLAIAVIREQVEIIQYVGSLYNTHCDRLTFICDPLKRNRSIFKALVLSFKTPKLLLVLL